MIIFVDDEYIKPRPNDCNISATQQCWAKHVGCGWPPCWEVLRYDATCWVLFAQVRKWSNFSCNICGWCCTRLPRFVQHVRPEYAPWHAHSFDLATPYMSEHATVGWPNAFNMLRLTMLWYVWSKRNHRLAGACKHWANNVALYVALKCCGLLAEALKRRLFCLGE